MKTIVIIMTLISVVCFAHVVNAETKTLPKGAVVSAICNADDTATLKIDGVAVEVLHKYYFKGIRREIMKGKTETTFNLSEGRRFNFQFDGGFYVLLTPQMAQGKYRAKFLGNNIDIDDSDPSGCAFIIICQ